MFDSISRRRPGAAVLFQVKRGDHDTVRLPLVRWYFFFIFLMIIGVILFSLVSSRFALFFFPLSFPFRGLEPNDTTKISETQLTLGVVEPVSV